MNRGRLTADDSLTLTDVTFSGNMAVFGSAIYNTTSAPTLMHVMLSGNSATGRGGVMYNYAGTPTIRNTILWGNTAQVVDPQVDNDGSTPGFFVTASWKAAVPPAAVHATTFLRPIPTLVR